MTIAIVGRMFSVLLNRYRSAKRRPAKEAKQMAKKRVGSHVVDGIEPDAAPETTASAAQPAEEKPPLTSEQLRAMFDAWKSTDDEMTAAKAAVEAVAERRSETVRVIVEALGNKGPWTVDGQRLSATERGGKFHIQKESDAKLTL